MWVSCYRSIYCGRQIVYNYSLSVFSTTCHTQITLLYAYIHYSLPFCSFPWRTGGSFSSHTTVLFRDLEFVSLRIVWFVLFWGTKSFATLCFPRFPSFTALLTAVELWLRTRSSRHTATAFLPWYDTPVRNVRSTCVRLRHIRYQHVLV